MADRKVSQLTSMTATAPPDQLLIVDDPNGTPTSKKITVKTLFGAIPSNTAISANLTVSGNRAHFASNVRITKSLTTNTIILTKGSAPSTNNTATEGWTIGQARLTNTHLYIATDATTIRRLALETF